MPFACYTRTFLIETFRWKFARFKDLKQNLRKTGLFTKDSLAKNPESEMLAKNPLKL